MEIHSDHSNVLLNTEFPELYSWAAEIERSEQSSDKLASWLTVEERTAPDSGMLGSKDTNKPRDRSTSGPALDRQVTQNLNLP